MAAIAASPRPIPWVNPFLGVRIREVDGLRGTAILLVLFFHYITSISAPEHHLWSIVTTTTRLFWSGVDLFFVLSGFLISGILIDSADSPHYYKTFYLRRFHRIFPLYFGWLALLYLGVSLSLDSKLGTHIFHSDLPLWLYPVFLQNNAPLLLNVDAPVWMAMSWSLAVEEQFYLVLPALVRFLNRTVLGWLCAATILLSPIFRYLLVHYNPGLNMGWPFSTFARLDSLAMGVSVALLARNETCWNFLTRRAAALKGCALLLFCVLVLITYFPRPDSEMGLYGFSILGLFYSLLLVLAICRPVSAPALSAVLKNGLLLYLGRVSYAIYILHQGVRALVDVMVPKLGHFNSVRVIAVVALALLTTILLANLSWSALESKLIRRAHLRYKY